MKTVVRGWKKWSLLILELLSDNALRTYVKFMTNGKEIKKIRFCFVVVVLGISMQAFEQA
jgi:hypothetical protein